MSVKRFLAGGLSLALIVFLMTVGCVFDNTQSPNEDAPLPEGHVWVNFSVSKPESRSLDASHSPSFIDYYEVYLRDRGLSTSTIGAVDGTEPLYVGSAREGRVLRVSVPPDHNYDVLLLAGVWDTKVLLASAFRNNNGATEYSLTGTGYSILPNQTNSITLTLAYIDTVPLTGGVNFSTDADPTPSPFTPGVTTGSGTFNSIMMARLPSKTAITSAATTAGTRITVTVKTKNVKKLIEADDDAGTTYPIFSSMKLSLKQASENHPVSSMIAEGTNAVISVSGTDDIQIVYNFWMASNGANWPDYPTSGPQNQQGGFGRLYYELKYRAFGRPDSDTVASSVWNIRNGFDPIVLDKGAGSSGGAILVILGNDPGDYVPWSPVEVPTE